MMAAQIDCGGGEVIWHYSGIPQNPGQEIGADVLTTMLIWKLDADCSFGHELVSRTSEGAALSQLYQPPDKLTS
ncbi:MAG: hypothetical protein JW986_00805 [Methanotrichaceae archaeon]|nr:hypothetical protein [Methanotrichaceae archaeon]